MATIDNSEKFDKSFIFYETFSRYIDTIQSPDEKLKVYEAIVKYGLYQEIPKEQTQAIYIALLIAKPTIDANLQKRENGKKGGEYGKNGGRPKKNDSTENPTGDNEITPNVNDNCNDNGNVNDNVNGNVDDINKKESKKEYKENGGRYRTYEDVFDEFGVEPTVRDKLIEFTKACYVNKHIISNDKLENIIVRLDKAYYKDETAKCRCIDRAISGGYFDIKTDK